MPAVADEYTQLDPFKDTYAPSFRLSVDGKELDALSHGDVLEIKVTLEANALSQADLTLNNWDDEHLTFKYSDFKRIRPLSIVRLELGYAENLAPMIEGFVTGLSPSFPEGGPPTLGVTVTDKLFRLKRSKPTSSAPFKAGITDGEIASAVALRHHLDAIVDTDTEPTTEAVYQKDQDDATFLLDRARRIGFEVYVQTNPKTNKDALYFVRRGRRNDAGRYTLQWGRNLINFTPSFNLSDQVTSVTVRGWNPATKTPVEATANADDLTIEGDLSQTGPAILAAALGNSTKNEVIVDDAVTTDETAKLLATAKLVERSRLLMTATGKVIGLPDLRPGYLLRLRGLGEKFNGDNWLLKKVVHSFGSSGYLTDFEVTQQAAGDGGTGGGA